MGGKQAEVYDLDHIKINLKLHSSLLPNTAATLA